MPGAFEKLSVILEAKTSKYERDMASASSATDDWADETEKAGTRAEAAAKKSQGAFSKIQRAIKSTRSEAKKPATFAVEAEERGFTGVLNRIRGIRKETSKDAAMRVRFEERGAAGVIASSKAVSGALDRLDGRDVTVDFNEKGLTGLRSGLGEVASGIRNVSTVAKASALPFMIAGMGAGVSTVLALAGSVGGLALNLGKAAAGFTLVGGAAAGGAYTGLAAYTKLLSSTVSSSRAAYEATHEHRMELLEKRRQEILNTKASAAFNAEIDRQLVGFTKLQAAVGSRVFPMFESEMKAWGGVLRSNRGEIVDTAGVVTRTAQTFSAWFRTAESGKVFDRTLGFINSSAIKGSRALSGAGRAGISAFQPLIPLASKLQGQLVGLTNKAAKWTASAEGQARLGAVYRGLYADAKQLGPVLMDAARGTAGLFSAIDQAGLADQASAGLAKIASGYAKIGVEGSTARSKTANFLNQSRELMPFVSSAAGKIAGSVGRVATAAIGMRTEGSKLTILQEIFRGIGDSARPLERLVLGTFRALGPEIAIAIPNLARLAETFAGSSGPLTTYAKILNRAMGIFNSLPGPVKTTVANLVAFKMITGSMGLTGLIGGVGRLVAQYWAMSRASKASALALKQSNIAMKGAAGANAAAGAAAAGSAGKMGFFARMGGVAATAARGLGVAVRFMLGPWGLLVAGVATGAVLIYKNWDKIKAAGGALVNWYQSNFPKTSATIGHVFQTAQRLAAAFAQGGLKLVQRAGAAVVSWFGAHWPEINDVLVAGGRLFGRALSAMTLPLRMLIKAGTGVVRFFVGHWPEISGAARSVAAAVGQTLASMKNGAVRWVQSLPGAVTNFWKNRVWQPAATFVMEKANGIMQTLGNWKARASSWLGSLPGAIYEPWKNRIWQPAATFVMEKANGIMTTLGNWKTKAVSWVTSLPQAVGSVWNKVWQGMADFVAEKKDGILTTVGNLQSGIVDGFTAIVGFINKVLSAVNLPTINLSGGSGSGSSGAGSPPSNSGQQRQTNFARGGVWDPREPGAAKYARGGMWNADRGGVGDGKTIGAITNEAGEREAIVNLERRTPESQHAFRAAERSPNARARYREEDHEHAHRAGRLGRLRAFAAGGVWTPEVAEVNQEIENKFGVQGSTYSGHGRNANAATSIDWAVTGWNTAAMGAARAKGDAIAQHLVSNWDRFSTEYLIWYEKMKESLSGAWSTYRGGGGYAAPTTNSGWHRDHVHYSAAEPWGGPESLTGGGGGGSGFIASLWDTVGSALWNRLVQPPVDALAGSLGASGAGVFGDIAAKMVTNTASSIKDYIIGEAGSSSAGSSGPYKGGGSLDEWAKNGLILGNAFPPTASNISKIKGRAMQESGGDPNAVNNWDSNAAAGAPSKGLMQVIEPTWNSNTTPEIGQFDQNWNDPVKSVGVASRYMKSAYGYVVGPTGSGYARGGIAGKDPGDRKKLDMPSPVKNAFLKVADTLASMAGYGPKGGIQVGDRGGVGTGSHLVGITNEAGPEAIVPLRRQTPEGREALHVANRKYGVAAYASGGVSGGYPVMGWNLVGNDSYLGVNNQAGPEYSGHVSAAISAVNAMGGLRVGPGDDVTVTSGYLGRGIAGMTYQDGRIVLSPVAKNPAGAARHEMLHAAGHPHNSAVSQMNGAGYITPYDHAVHDQLWGNAPAGTPAPTKGQTPPPGVGGAPGGRGSSRSPGFAGGGFSSVPTSSNIIGRLPGVRQGAQKSSAGSGNFTYTQTNSSRVRDATEGWGRARAAARSGASRDDGRGDGGTLETRRLRESSERQEQHLRQMQADLENLADKLGEKLLGRPGREMHKKHQAAVGAGKRAGGY